MDPNTDDPTTIHVRRALEGSAEDLGWIYQRFYGCLFHQARRYLERVPLGLIDAEELVQETWAVVCAKLPELGQFSQDDRRATPRLMKYLSTTLRQLQMNHRRREIYRRQTAGRGGGGSGDSDATGHVVDRVAELPEETRGVFTRIVQREATDKVEEAIAGLSEEDRAVFIVRGIERAPVSVAAQLLELKPNTVSKRYNRCLEKLRAQLPDSIFADFPEDEAPESAA